MSMEPTFPFNDRRYDLVVAYVLSKTGKAFDIYDLVKIHALVDSFHLVETGRPTIGGALEPWTHGPVVRPAYARAKRMLEGTQSREMFEPVGEPDPNGVLRIREGYSPDPDNFTRFEIEAMNKAAAIFKRLSKTALYQYFHSKNTFIGSAWNLANDENRPLLWNDVIDAYERLEKKPKRLARLALATLGA